MKRWSRFLAQFQKDLKLWLFCVVYLFIFRVILILLFRGKMGDGSGVGDVVAALLNGFRYDSMVGGYVIVFPFLLSFGCVFAALQKIADRLRKIFGSVFVISATLICGITIGYFREFDDQFNLFLFGIYQDDTRAILITIWKEYPLLPALLAMGVVIALLLILKDRLIRTGFFPEEVILRRRLPLWMRGALTFLAFVMVFIAMRGSLGRRPAQRKDAAITTDEFLNKTILNPFLALKYAIKDHRAISKSSGLKCFLPDGDIRRAAEEYFSTDGSSTSLDDAMRRTAAGPTNTPARHIFLVVMESYDSWPLMEKYRSLGLAGRLKEIAAEGLYIDAFLPAASGTMTSLGAIVTGLADAGLQTNLQPSSRQPYPASMAENFNRLGYKTRFFYGGYLSWRRVGDFCRDQGFGEVYGASHMGKWVTSNEWGVDDESLFEFIESKVTDDQPSFNLILTTTCHPPYDIDVYAKGFPLRCVPDDLKEEYDGSVSLKILGHLWYSDQCLGDFVAGMEAGLPESVFAITGDHAGRKFINTRPDFFEGSAVPLVLYGRKVLDGISLPPKPAGSHLDITPTLIELAAPKGFNYYAIGRNLLAPSPNPLGIARGKVIGPDFIVDIKTGKVHPIADRPPPPAPPPAEKLRRLHNTVHGMSWWRVKKGADLPGVPPVPQT